MTRGKSPQAIVGRLRTRVGFHRSPDRERQPPQVGLFKVPTCAVLAREYATDQGHYLARGLSQVAREQPAPGQSRRHQAQDRLVRVDSSAVGPMDKTLGELDHARVVGGGRLADLSAKSLGNEAIAASGVSAGWLMAAPAT